MELLEKTGVGRDINRHYFTDQELRSSLDKPVVKNLIELIKFRNSHPSFNGDFALIDSEDHVLDLKWVNGEEFAELSIDFQSRYFKISFSESGSQRTLENEFKFNNN